MGAVTEKPGVVPDLVSPMQPSAGSGQAPTGPDWVVELAWTGHRCIAHVEPGRRTRLLSARGVSMSAAYPELGPPLERRSPPRGMVLDGTLVARGEEHAPRASLLQRRSARMQPTEQHIRAVPVDFQIADLLWLDGHSTVDLAYRDRRVLLEGLGFAGAPVWTTSPMPVSELAGMIGFADAKGVDSLHARHLGSRYHPGGRSPLWVKVPVPRVRQVVVGGWTATDPARPDTIASLLLGIPAGSDASAGLRYVGRVGVPGDDRRRLTELRRLRADHPPFVDALPADAARHAIWVLPRLVGSVEFTGFVSGGRLRLPRWLGPVVLSQADLRGADQAEAHGRRWARPSEPPPEAEPPPPDAEQPLRQAADSPLPPPPVAGSPPPQAGSPQAPPSPVAAPPVATSPAPDPVPVQTRRLEQHFVYNSLNTIAALIRTDPGRARELLVGFADLSRAADQAGNTTSTLGRELDAVRGYLQLEQARFGARLRIELDVDAALHGMPVEPLRVLGAVRTTVQQGIEPRPDGGVLSVVAVPVDGGCTVTVSGGDADTTVIAVVHAADARSSTPFGSLPV